MSLRPLNQIVATFFSAVFLLLVLLPTGQGIEAASSSSQGSPAARAPTQVQAQAAFEWWMEPLEWPQPLDKAVPPPYP
jgi:hypothetical protein